MSWHFGKGEELFSPFSFDTDKSVYRVVNETLIKRNWLLDIRIHYKVLKEQRAEYGEQIIKSLANRLTERYGTGYSRNNLCRFVSFFKSFQELFLSVQVSSEIVPAVSGQFEIVLLVPGFSESVDIYGSLKPAQTLRLS